MKYSKDGIVCFNPDNHTYLKGEKRLQSVTSLIEKFKNKFDKDFHSKRIAEKTGITQEEVLAQWEAKGKKSREIGTAVHLIFEDYINNNYCILNGKLDFAYPKLEYEYLIDYDAKRKVAIKFIEDLFLTGRLIPIYSEFIVHDDDIAGQLDLICQNQKKKGFILDFKTNETIEEYSYGKKMLNCLNEFNDSSFYHYSLQLSIYKELFKEFEINDCFIAHLKTDSYHLMKCEKILNFVSLPEIKKFI